MMQKLMSLIFSLTKNLIINLSTKKHNKKRTKYIFCIVFVTVVFPMITLTKVTFYQNY